MTAPVEVENAFAAVDDDLGAVTLAVACAGMAGLLGPLRLVDPEAWWRAVEVDLRGSMLTARAGRFVMVYGNLGDWLGAYVSAFAAAKAGMARLTEVLAGDVEDSGVRVFGVHPGFVRTPLTKRLAVGCRGSGVAAAVRRRSRGPVGRWPAGGRAGRGDRPRQADALSGRILHAGDDLAELAERCRVDQDLRRLRLRWDPPANG